MSFIKIKYRETNYSSSGQYGYETSEGLISLNNLKECAKQEYKDYLDSSANEMSVLTFIYTDDFKKIVYFSTPDERDEIFNQVAKILED